MTTLVTALYDINREAFDGRKFEEYFPWFRKTLELNSNFVVFTEEKVREIIPKQDNIKIITLPLQDLYLFKFKNKMDFILNSSEFKQKMADLNRIECKTSLYNLIQYSKFEFLQSAIKNNYFNSEYFFWIDAGCSRFFENIDISKPFPNVQKIRKDRFTIQGNINTMQVPIDKDYVWKSDCVLVGTFFGGTKEVVSNVSDKIIYFFENEMLKKNILNNEQISLAFIALQNPTLFDVYIELNGKHLPILKYLE